MATLQVWFIFAAIFLATSANLAFACPDTAAGETQEDCPWAGIARKLQSDALAKNEIQASLKKNAAPLYAQLVADSKNTEWKNLWGQSLNYDEFARGVIIERPILDALAATFKVQALHGDVIHAGLEHTYGYLFSTLKTPFGYKRARWVRGELEKGLGLPKGTLGPLPQKGTLFSNVTYFMGRIAFRSDPEKLAVLKKGESKTARVVSRYKYENLKPIRIEEDTKVAGVKLRTDLVPFPKKSPNSFGGTNTHLLIYSMTDASGPKLITAFPVEEAFVKKVSEPRPVVTRYNAYIEGITKKPQHDPK